MIDAAMPGAAPLRAVAEARRVLAECLAAESEAERALAAAEAAIWDRRDTAAAPSDDDEAVEDFALWLPQGRRTAAAAQVALDRAAADTARARAALALARAAAEQHAGRQHGQAEVTAGTPMRRRGDVPPQ